MIVTQQFRSSRGRITHALYQEGTKHGQPVTQRRNTGSLTSCDRGRAIVDEGRCVRAARLLTSCCRGKLVTTGQRHCGREAESLTCCGEEQIIVSGARWSSRRRETMDAITHVLWQSKVMKDQTLHHRDEITLLCYSM